METHAAPPTLSPKSYVDAVKTKQDIILPSTLSNGHWVGTYVDKAEIMARAAKIEAGQHLVCGVYHQPPADLLQLSIPVGATLTIVVRKLPTTCSDDILPVTAPAIDKRGFTRIHKMGYIQLGDTKPVLSWKSVSLDKEIVSPQSVVLRVQLFARHVDAKVWANIIRKPQRSINDLVLKTLDTKPGDVIDIFGFRKPDTSPFVSASLRVQKPAVDKFLKASGQGGLLVKALDATGAVEWVKPNADESGEDYLARARQLALDSPQPGLAFSSTGSLGLRRPEEKVRATFAARGFPRGASTARILDFLRLMLNGAVSTLHRRSPKTNSHVCCSRGFRRVTR